MPEVSPQGDRVALQIDTGSMTFGFSRRAQVRTASLLGNWVMVIRLGAPDGKSLSMTRTAAPFERWFHDIYRING